MSDVSLARIGWLLSALLAFFMLGASVAPKLLGLPVAQETMSALGWDHSPILLIGLLELTCTILFLVPATSLLGAVLMMAIYGGAIATQLRAGSPLLSHTAFAVYLGITMWAGLWLRTPKLRALFPFARS